MELGLLGKTVFITASTSGIGKAIAEAFLREGAAVIINGRSQSKLDDAVNILRKKFGDNKVYGIQGDMSENGFIRDTIYKMKEFVSHIDIIVGNLGTGKPISDDKFDLEEWQYMLKVNLLSAVGLIHDALDLFSDSGGSIVLMGSLAAHERIGAPPAYAAAKAGVISLVKYAAPILIRRGIRINAVSPGNIFFQGGRWEELTMQEPDGTKEYLETEVPMKRFGTSEEIAETVLFLASERSGFTTGSVIQADGGQSRGI